ncbi:hypothetical protein ABGB18_29970 [Nonomuraea sp. B12E4]|uniref:hypothetical protein n=1 Tax=Nonomuraea sp. B12E4 TaxID=3153564 RepID=UPI00325E6E55
MGSRHPAHGARDRADRPRARRDRTPATPVPGPPPPIPPRSEEHARSWLGSGFGHGRALDWRFVTGHPGVTGLATALGKLTILLVGGEETTPLERLALFANSATASARRRLHHARVRERA